MTEVGSRGLASHRLTSAIRSNLAAPSSGSERRAGAVEEVDRWLRSVWAGACEASGVEPDSLGLALAAVGGHARRDSGPAGDLDLVLIHDDALPATRRAAFAEHLWYPIWDNGFRLDHAVRNVAGCRQMARQDLAVAVGILELRPVAGDAELVLRARHVLREDWRRDARRRLPEIVAGVSDRLARHGELANLLEPDLKHACGGLRDAAVIDAVVATWLADSPHGEWQGARSRLLDIRDALHAVAGRPTERLILPEQDAVAAALGLPDADALLTEVSSCGRTIAYALDQTLRSAQQALVVRRGLRRLTAPRLRTVERGLAVYDNEIVTLPSSIASPPDDDATLALRAAAAAARQGVALSPTSARRLAETAAVSGLPAPWPVVAREAFIEILSAGTQLPALWETLDHTGLVQGWLPEWGSVRSRPQRNAVHRYTVDRHCVQTCVEAAGIGLHVERPDLLLLACLLHDIGKQPGEHDHSAAGAPIAATICRRMGYPDADVELVQRLVVHHLLLVDLATRRDPDDPATVAVLADAVSHDRETLDMLRILTEADARAAGPAAWTGWRARLVDDLAGRARAVLAGRPVPSPSPLAPDEQEMVRQVRHSGQPAIAVSELADSVAITFVAPDRTGLFADSAGILAAQGITVRTALIRTVDGIAVDTWWSSAHAVVDPSVLLTALNRLTAGDSSVLDRLVRREAAYRPPQWVMQAPQVFLVPGASAGASVFEVRALDRPGLLHGLGAVLREAGVDIRSAHVATLAGRAVDVLYLAESAGRASAGPGGPSVALSPARTAEVIRLLTAAAGFDQD